MENKEVYKSPYVELLIERYIDDCKQMGAIHDDNRINDLRNCLLNKEIREYSQMTSFPEEIKNEIIELYHFRMWQISKAIIELKNDFWNNVFNIVIGGR